MEAKCKHNPTLEGCWGGSQTPSKQATSEREPHQSASRPPILVDERAAAIALGVGVRSFHKLRKEPWFPPAIVLGPRSLRFDLSEIQEALRTRAPRVTVQAEPGHLEATRAERGAA